MFDPTIGRWFEEDPLGFVAGDHNLFRYAANRPTHATDPSGLRISSPITAPPSDPPNFGAALWLSARGAVHDARIESGPGANLIDTGGKDPTYQVSAHARGEKVPLGNAFRGTYVTLNLKPQDLQQLGIGADECAEVRVKVTTQPILASKNPGLEWAASSYATDPKAQLQVEDTPEGAKLKLPLNLLSANKLPNSINMYNFKLRFEVSVGGGAWLPILAAPNKYTLFATFAPPKMGPPPANLIPRTLIQAGCVAAAGVDTNDEAAVVDAVFKAFTKRNFSTWDGQPISYYANWAHLQNPPKTVPEVLDQRNGVCGQWVQVFTQMLRAQGIAPTGTNGIYNVQARGSEAFLIKGQWGDLQRMLRTPHGVLASPGFDEPELRYGWVNERDSGARQFLDLINPKDGNSVTSFPNQLGWNSLSDFKMRPADAAPLGQNNPNPAPAFTNHAVVKWGSVVYDPSYGRRFASDNDFVIQSITAFALDANVPAANLPRPFAKLADKDGFVSIFLFREPRGAIDLKWSHLNDLTTEPVQHPVPTPTAPAPHPR